MGDLCTRQIGIKAGVKQGCPLSSLLFNLIMDELLDRVKSTGIGIPIVNKERLLIMAFADDLVIASEESTHMEILLKVYKEFFEEKSLKVNAKKCGSLMILPVKGRVLMKVVNRKHRKWGTDWIPSLDF